jgi:hypothetical protein
VNKLVAKYSRPIVYPLRKLVKPPQYEENPQIRRAYHFKLGRRMYSMSNRKNVIYEEPTVEAK